MTIDDPGWGGIIGDEPGVPGPDPAAPEALAPDEAQVPPADSARGSSVYTAPPAMPPSPAQKTQRKRAVGAIIGAVAFLVIAGGSIGAVFAFKKSPSTTTTSSPSAGSTVTTAAGTTGPSGNTGSGSLISVVPSALSGKCATVPSADFVTSSVTSAVSCDALGVSGSSADVIGYARFGSTAALSSYFSSLLSANSLSTGVGDCSTGSLTGTASSGNFCEGSYTDSAGNAGDELAFVGSAFNLGGAAGSTSAACQASFPGSTGASVVAWTSPSDDSFGFAVDCTASSASFVDGMESNLLHAAYTLND
jgi:hypothetical protein